MMRRKKKRWQQWAAEGKLNILLRISKIAVNLMRRKKKLKIRIKINWVLLRINMQNQKVHHMKKILLLYQKLLKMVLGRLRAKKKQLNKC